MSPLAFHPSLPDVSHSPNVYMSPALTIIDLIQIAITEHGGTQGMRALYA